MAKSGDNGPAEPDFEMAANIIRGEIMGDRESLSKTQGDLSASWKRVQDSAHVNKGAAKSALAILNKSPSTRADHLRSFAGMLTAFKIPGLTITYNPGDLVDQAQGDADGDED